MTVSLPAPIPPGGRPGCSIEGCARPAQGRTGWCHTHYEHNRRYGRPQPLTVEDRFWAKVRVIPCGGCWEWQGHLAGGGYGGFSDGRNVYAHRWAYEHLIAPIPDGLQIDHLCRNRACVNPAHLEPVTQTENQMRGLKGSLVTHCPQGHPYDEENTRWRKDRPNGRGCITCDRVRWSRSVA